MTLAGRDGLIEDAVSALAGGRSMLLHGPAGIGKSTLIRAIVDRLSATGTRVLSAAPAEIDAGLPHIVLIDLLAGVLPYARDLPPHLRDALEIALLRMKHPEGASDSLSIRLAVLELLRRLAQDGRVLLVLDDLQWADDASAEVLAFAARRLDTAQVTILAAERTDGGEPRALSLNPDTLRPVAVPPLDLAAITQLLADDGRDALSATALRRVHAAGGGNPLYTLELGRALAQDDSSAAHRPLPVPAKLRALLSRRLAGLDDETRTSLLHAAAMGRPTLQLLADVGVLPQDGLDAAEQAGIVTIGADGAVSFSHPLLRETVYANATTGQRRSAHTAIAAVVHDAVEKVSHLAQGSIGQDERIAALADAAAAEAARRGAPSTAATMARLAAQKTPPAHDEAIARRLLDGARYAFAAGQVPEARDAATACLHKGGSGPVRVAARLLLVELAGQDLAAARALLAGASDDAGDDPELQAQVTLYESDIAYFLRQHEEAAVLAERAEQLARQAGDVDMVIRALDAQATVELTLGRERAYELQAAAYQMAAGRPLTDATVLARRAWAITSLFRGDLRAARDDIARLEAEVRAHGMVAQLMSVLISATAIYVRCGYGTEALRTARECHELCQDSGLAPGVGQGVAANAQWFAGTTNAAVQLAAQSVATCAATGDDEWLEVAYAFHGQALMLAGQHHAAVAAFSRAADLETASRSVDPAVIPWHADHAEALAMTGRLDEANDLIKRTRYSAERLQRSVVMLGLARADAVRQCMASDSAGAAQALAAAIATHRATSYPLDVARSLLALGQLLRRARRKAAAREAVVEAIEQFRLIQAAPWQAKAQRELDRLTHGTRPPTTVTTLSDQEWQIVDLVRAGASNREISRTVHLSVKAVEAILSRIYRRLGVRNRSEMLLALNDR